MAASTLPAPCTTYGPCATTCEHRDCAETRRAATTACVYCGRPIGYEALFYREGDSNLSHATCAEDAAESV